MAGTKNHDYHILEPDIWPLIGAFAALTFTTGMVFFMHEMNGWQIILGLGIAAIFHDQELESGLGFPAQNTSSQYKMPSRLTNAAPRPSSYLVPRAISA